MEKVRIGIIGLGNMGSAHVNRIVDGEIPNGVLAAVCDLKPDRLEWAKSKAGAQLPCFDNAEKMMDSGLIDAVVIATPHYAHPPLGILALKKGLHVLSEKPAGVNTSEVKKLIAVAEKSDKVYGIMFNQRKRAVCQTLKRHIDAGDFGQIKRMVWIITNWYRPQSYYDSGDWRATWSGEGGGVLMNQCPHNLDLWQWFFGMPKRVWCDLTFGKYHDIEVEDDVTAYLQYENGATGLFVTSTGETPGTDRLEISADMGKIVMENDKITFWKNEIGEREFNATWDKGFGNPKTEKIELAIEGDNDQHTGIMNDWVHAIQTGSPLMAPGIEGIRGLTLCNAMYLSGWTHEWAELPLDEQRFNSLLSDKVKTSRRKEAVDSKVFDTSNTY